MLRLSLLGSLLLPPAVSAAQSVPGLYVSGETGGNFAGSMLSSGEATKVYTNAVPLGALDLGWAFSNGLRVEIEGSDRSNRIDGVSTLRVNEEMLPLSNVNGAVATPAAMANVIYDLPLHAQPLPLQPYIGAGLGYGWLQFNDASGNGTGRLQLPENNLYIGPDLVNFGNAGAFAYQAIAGVSLPLHFLPGLSATLEYRFFGTAEANVPVTRTATTATVINGAIPSAATRNGFEVHDNAVLIGLRYTFGAL